MTQLRVGNRNVNLDAQSKADRFCERAHLFSVSSPQQRLRDYRPSQPFTFLSCIALLRSPALQRAPRAHLPIVRLTSVSRPWCNAR
jgi:hypothetical protein